MRIALIGYGAVAEVHARQLAAQPGVSLVSVCGPRCDRAAAFAAAHRIPLATSVLKEALAGADAAVVASPSGLHAEHATQALDAGAHVMVELPACETAREARTMGELAARKGLTLMCAHTSRYLAPYRSLREWLSAGEAGVPRQVHYLRHLVPAKRRWIDDALLHHGSHAVDLLLDWFGGMVPLACAAAPQVRHAQDVCVLAALPGHAPASITISYSSPLPQAEMTVVGSAHTAVTDGFSFLRSDDPGLSFAGAATEVYHRAVCHQDEAFVRACCGHANQLPWQDTIRLVATMEEIRQLADRSLAVAADADQN